MAERYQVRGRRIWDSETDTYSGLFGIVDNAEWVIKHRDVSKFPFKPLAEWQDDKPAGERYQVKGRRIWDSETDTYTALFGTEELAEQMIRRADGYQFKPLSEWQDDKPAGDDVNHPSHYTQGPVECIDAIASALGRDAFIEFLRGQVIKYMWRLGHKGDALKDAEKGKWYASRLVAELAK